MFVLFQGFLLSGCQRIEANQNFQQWDSNGLSNNATPVINASNDSLNFYKVRNLKDSILGVWWESKNDPSAAFEIRERDINYPEQLAAYKYKLHNDTLFISFPDEMDTCKVSMNSYDSLILINKYRTAVFYRGK